MMVDKMLVFGVICVLKLCYEIVLFRMRIETCWCLVACDIN